MKNFILAFLLFTSSYAMAQNTTAATGNLIDGDSQAWANATWSAKILVPGGQPARYKDGTLVPTYTGQLDANGQISGPVANTAQVLPTGATEQFTVCSNTSASCQVFVPFAITGSTFDVGTVLSRTVQAPRFLASSMRYAYNTNEILDAYQGTGFLNTITRVTYVWTGLGYQPVSGGGTSIALLTNSVPNTVQNRLNLVPGSGISIVTDANGNAQFTNTSTGTFAIAPYNSVTGLTSTGNSATSGYTPFATLFATNHSVTTGTAGDSATPCPSFQSIGSYGDSYYTTTGSPSRTLCRLGLYPTTTSPEAFSLIDTYKTPLVGTIWGGGYSHNKQDIVLHDQSGLMVSGSWPNTTANELHFYATAAGLKGLYTRTIVNTGLGDFNGYSYGNIRSGNSSLVDDEGRQPDHWKDEPVNDYKGTVQAVTSNTVINVSTANNNCGLEGDITAPGVATVPCYGQGAQLIALNAASTVHVTALTPPNPGSQSLGQLTVTETLVGIVRSGTVISAAPWDQGINHITGRAFTSSFNPDPGLTWASSGVLCWVDNLSTESNTYSISGGNITINNQRYPHGANSIVFSGGCNALVSTPDIASMGGNMTSWYSVVTGTHNITYWTNCFSHLCGSWLGNTTFKPGVTGRNLLTYYQAATVIGTFDPATTTGRGTDTGYLQLEDSNATWNVNDPIEEPFYASNYFKTRSTLCGDWQTNNVYSVNDCNDVEIDNNVDYINQYRLDNKYANIDGATGNQPHILAINRITTDNVANAGVYDTLNDIELSPRDALTLVNFDSLDPNAPNVYNLVRDANHNHWGYNRTTGRMEMQWDTDFGTHKVLARTMTLNGQDNQDASVQLGTSQCHITAVNGSLWFNPCAASGQLHFTDNTGVDQNVMTQANNGNNLLEYFYNITTQTGTTNDGFADSRLTAASHCNLMPTGTSGVPVPVTVVVTAGLLSVYHSITAPTAPFDLYCTYPH